MLEGESYQFTCLPFGLSCAPHTFTKVLKPVMTLLRSWGVRIIVYIDDMLILADTPEQASQHLQTLLWILQALGVHCQSRQVCIHASPRDKVPGSGSQLSINGALSPRGEAETDQGRGYKAPLPITGVSQSSISVYREAKRGRSGSSPSSPVLPTSAGQPEKRPRLWQPWLRECDNSIPASSGGTELVATTPLDMEWQVPTQGQRADTDLLRCHPLGMGSNVQWDMDWRPMIRTGEDMAHQLPGIASSLSCSSYIPEGQVRNLCATAVGQHHHSGLHQQSGGTVSPQLTSLARSLWLWALQRDISLTAQHIPSVSNLVADTESRTMRDRTDWKLSPAIFDRINHIFGPLEVDLFASRLTYQLPHYFSWRPDPLAEATDAFQQDWGPLKGFSNPPWCLIGRVLSQVMGQKAQVILVAPIWKG